MLVFEEKQKYNRPMGPRPKNDEFYQAVAKRLRLAFGQDKLKEVEFKLGGIVTYHALYDYLNRDVIPRPDVLKRISEVYDVSVDWLLKGDESERPVDGEERAMFKQMRQARTLGIAEEALEYVNYLIKKKEKELKKKGKGKG